MTYDDAHQYDPFTGVVAVNGERCLIDFWLNLHIQARCWPTLSGANAAVNRSFYDKNTYKSLNGLLSFPAHTWKSLCTATGMTVYGAVALSWCKGADLSQVWEGWETSGFPIKPLPEYERPARFINPALLPATNSLMELARIVENKTLPICAMIVAKGDALDVDLTPGQAANASPQIASFLKAHMEQKQNCTDEQNQMIETWAGIVSGTEWEM